MTWNTRLQIEFYKEDEAAVLFESNAPREAQDYGEILLFSSFAIRQMHLLGNNPLSRTLAHRLTLMETGIHEITKTLGNDAIKLVDYQGTGKKRFIGAQTFGDGKSSFSLDFKGFGILDNTINFYFRASVIALLQCLGSRHVQNDAFLTRLGHASNLCGLAYLSGDVSIIGQSVYARAIADSVFKPTKA